MTIRQMIQNEIMNIQDEPMRSIFSADLKLFYEFLEQETEMDCARFLELVMFFAHEYCGMCVPEDVWENDDAHNSIS